MEVASWLVVFLCCFFVLFGRNCFGFWVSPSNMHSAYLVCFIVCRCFTWLVAWLAACPILAVVVSFADWRARPGPWVPQRRGTILRVSIEVFDRRCCHGERGKRQKNKISSHHYHQQPSVAAMLSTAVVKYLTSSCCGQGLVVSYVVELRLDNHLAVVKGW